jgi:hypothetical protein
LFTCVTVVSTRELIFSQTEDYVEYSRHGKVLKGEEQTTVRSRYDEDVLNNNHTAVWGSWWTGGIWGYKCCHSTIKNSYCTGTISKGPSTAYGTDGTSVADPGCLSRILDPNFSHPGSRIHGQKGSRSGSS